MSELAKLTAEREKAQARADRLWTRFARAYTQLAKARDQVKRIDKRLASAGKAEANAAFVDRLLAEPHTAQDGSPAAEPGPDLVTASMTAKAQAGDDDEPLTSLDDYALKHRPDLIAPFDPAEAIDLVTDDVKNLTGAQVYTLFVAEPESHWPGIARFIIRHRPELSEFVTRAQSRIVGARR